MKYFFVLLSLVGFTAFGQDAKADQILKQISDKVKNSSSFYIEYSANIKNSINGTNINQSGKGWVKGSKYYATYGEAIRLSNGKKIWTILKDDKIVYISDLDASDAGMNPKQLLTVWETGFKTKYEKETTLGSETVHMINLYPKDPKKTDYHTITVYVSKADNELKKATMKGKDGTTMNYTLNKLQFNTTVDDAKFVFDKSKFPGYQIVED